MYPLVCPPYEAPSIKDSLVDLPPEFTLGATKVREAGVDVRCTQGSSFSLLISRLAEMYITRERTAMMAEFLDIPKGVGPLDLSIYATIKSYCRLFSDPNLMEK